MEEFPTFKGLILTLDRIILHTVMHHSSTFTYIPNFIETEETFCGWTDGQMDGHIRPTLLGRLAGVNLKSSEIQSETKFQMEVPLFIEIPRSPYNTT